MRKRPGYNTAGPHTRAVRAVTKKVSNKLPPLIQEARGLIERNAFLVRRSEYLLQQSIMLRSQAEELGADRNILVLAVARLADKIERVTNPPLPPLKRSKPKRKRSRAR